MKKDITRLTYDESSQILSDYFATHGDRIADIEKAIKYINNRSEISALELGCGDGRDGADINRRVASYIGIDYSKGMVSIANKQHTELNCKVANMMDFEYPKKLDIIFAYASLLHLEKKQVKKVLAKCSYSLKPGGILALSLKYGPKYSTNVMKDRAGQRVFYYYNPDIILKLANDKFTELHRDLRSKGDTKWFIQILRSKE